MKGINEIFELHASHELCDTKFRIKRNMKMNETEKQAESDEGTRSATVKSMRTIQQKNYIKK